jgi:curved DNA-binding protein CbpA
MPSFTYSARPAAGGDIRTGEIELTSKDEVISYLHKQKLIPVSVREKEKGLQIKFGTGIKTRDIVIFTRQFATMINAGLPIVRALYVLSEQTENAKLKEVVVAVRKDVEAGISFSDALGKHPDIFNDLYRAMVEAGETGGFEDIFSDLFGGGFGARRGGGIKQKGADVSYSLKIGFIEAANGARKRVQIGEGRTLDITIPPGTEDGQTLRLKGQGLPGFGGAPAGDAYVEVKVEPHPFFTRKDKDLQLDLPVSLVEAVLGGTVQVPTLAGKVSMKVPPGANTGTTLRLKGKGVPDRRGGAAGDLYVKLRVVLPEQPDAELKAFVEKWAENHAYDPRAKAGMG